MVRENDHSVDKSLDCRSVTGWIEYSAHSRNARSSTDCTTSCAALGSAVKTVASAARARRPRTRSPRTAATRQREPVVLVSHHRHSTPGPPGYVCSKPVSARPIDTSGLCLACVAHAADHQPHRRPSWGSLWSVRSWSSSTSASESLRGCGRPGTSAAEQRRNIRLRGTTRWAASSSDPASRSPGSKRTRSNGVEFSALR